MTHLAFSQTTEHENGLEMRHAGKAKSENEADLFWRVKSPSTNVVRDAERPNALLPPP